MKWYEGLVGWATSLLFTTYYVIVVYDLLRHCCLRLVTSLLFTTCYVIETVGGGLSKLVGGWAPQQVGDGRLTPKTGGRWEVETLSCHTDNLTVYIVSNKNIIMFIDTFSI